MRAYKSLSQMDIYLGGHSESIDKCGDGLLQDKEKARGPRLEKEKQVWTEED